MDDILRQLGTLFVGSVPTMILFLLLLGCYTVLMHRPLQRVLAERRERTAGAVERAEAAMAIADAKAQEYEARLRAARVEIQAARERQIAAWSAARDQAVTGAREAAQTRVRAARKALDLEAERSRASLESHIDELAEAILATVVPARGVGAASTGTGEAHS
jgi:F-type H+-transporting ATPase subunit b